MRLVAGEVVVTDRCFMAKMLKRLNALWKLYIYIFNYFCVTRLKD